MRPFEYHEGQREIQQEANSVAAADKLSHWVGPVAQFAREADLVVLACFANEALHVAAISGTPPLVHAHEHDGEIAVSLPVELADRFPLERPWGGIVINPATARRSRIAGWPQQSEDHIVVACTTAFTNCRKYMAPTQSVESARHIGPANTVALSLDDAWVVQMLANSETAFLVTATPSGTADASHRGGQTGFLHYDASHARLSWTEYLGDGMFVSTGNLRANPRASLVVLDLESGDALRVDFEATFSNLRADRRERVDALIQAAEPFPVQGRVEALVKQATRLERFCTPRQRVERRTRITSADTTSVQHPQ